MTLGEADTDASSEAGGGVSNCRRIEPDLPACAYLEQREQEERDAAHLHGFFEDDQRAVDGIVLPVEENVTRAPITRRRRLRRGKMAADTTKSTPVRRGKRTGTRMRDADDRGRCARRQRPTCTPDMPPR